MLEDTSEQKITCTYQIEILKERTLKKSNRKSFSKKGGINMAYKKDAGVQTSRKFTGRDALERRRPDALKKLDEDREERKKRK